MIIKPIQDKGLLARLLEKCIEILLKKECKKIGEVEIDINASSIEIIKGLIREVNIIAEEINYKDILFDKVELEASDVKIIFKINNKELSLKNNFIVKFKISLSANSLKTILLSKKWNWIGDMIIKELLDQDKLEDIKIENDQISIKASKDYKTVKEGKKINLKTKNGKLYLENKAHNKSIKIPIEDKVCISNVNIKDNLINISAHSSVSF
tara:strand:+ start:590 stop:1222 length:633 start_codon:yes stop_codon:yes gene_type:complete